MHVCALLPLLAVSADLQSPAGLPGLALWLDAADPEAVVLDGARVREWRDKSGHARHLAAPSDDARPELLKAGRNGHSLLAFDGAARWLAGPPVLPAGQAAYTIVAVWHPARNQGAQSVFEQAAVPLTGNSRAALLCVGGKYGFNGEGNDRHDLVPFAPREWRLACLDVDNTRENNVRVVDNGALYTGKSDRPEALRLGDSGVAVGRKAATDGEYLAGEIAEIIVFDSVLARPERLRLLDWLERKWGLDVLGWFRTADGTIVTGDFDGETWDEWIAQGTAFGAGPARGTLPNQMEVSGFVGAGLVNSYVGGDPSTGTLTSPPVRLERKYLSFLIGGGMHPGEACFNLLVDGQVVRTATGPNDKPGGTERLDPEQWDVADLVGKVVVFQVVDKATGGWGHLNLDELRQTDRKVPRLITQTRDLLADQRYLNFGVTTGAAKRITKALAGGTVVREFEIELADGEPEFYTILDVSAWHGQTLTLQVDRLPEGSGALALVQPADVLLGADNLYHERLRPQLHFTSRRGWNNDPNGLVWHAGEFHLFYQHNPYGVNWGNMHWGQAVSRDLVHWEELGEALYPDPLGPMFSGSAVVDEQNTTGWARGDEKPLVCMYTAAGNPCVQCLAYSTDRGRTFTKFEGNPVLPHIIGGNRDPKVIWYAPERKWILALYLDQNDFGLFASPDLKKWERLCTVTIPGTSECPEFFEIPLDGNAKDTRWIFYGGTGNYLVGRFDGRTFTTDSGPHRLNDGNCFYASQTFNGVPDGRRVQIAWGTVGMPGMPFNQMMDFPVELTLRTTAEGPRLFANPVREIATLHGEGKSWHDLTVRPGENPVAGLTGDLWHVKAELQPGEGTTCGLSLRGVAVTYDAKAGTLTCRERSVKLQPVGGVAKLELLLDRTSLEIWANDGERYLPMGVIPAADQHGLELFSRDGATVAKALEVWEMKGIW